MEGGPTFSTLLAQPGPSAPGPAAPTAAGGVTINDSAKQAAMANPLQQARIRTQASLEAVKRLSFELAKGINGGL